MLYQSNMRERQVRRAPGEVQGAATAAVSLGGAAAAVPNPHAEPQQEQAC